MGKKNKGGTMDAGEGEEYVAEGYFKCTEVSADGVYVDFDSDWIGETLESATGGRVGLYKGAAHHLYSGFRCDDKLILSDEISKLSCLPYFFDKHVRIRFKSKESSEKCRIFEIFSAKTLE